MANLAKRSLLSLGIAVLLFPISTAAQGASNSCTPSGVIPLTKSEPAAKIVIDPPLPGPLASRGVAIIEYCAQNLHIAPVFGPEALAISPRVGHVHVSVDNAPWVWADASGNPIILQHLSPGPHKVSIELNDANHYPLDKGTVTFVVPEEVATESHP